MVFRSAASKPSNLQIRILSAVVLGPLVLAATFAGGIVFDLLILAAALFGVREWVRLVAVDSDRSVLEASLACMLAVLLCFIAAGPLPGLLLLAGLIPALPVWLALRGGQHRRMVALGLPYVGLACMAMVWLRGEPGIGLGLVLWLCLTIWATDIGAYAAGRSIGGPKLWPAISPNKTWAGLGGGIVGAALIGGAGALVLDATRPALAVPLGALLAVVAQGGDLFESAVKRRSGVKDSGRLIPGHGGILDRIDGFMTAAPVLALFHATLGKAMQWW